MTKYRRILLAICFNWHTTVVKEFTKKLDFQICPSEGQTSNDFLKIERNCQANYATKPWP